MPAPPPGRRATSGSKGGNAFIRRYLSRYGQVAPLPEKTYDHVLTVPACHEPEDFLQRLLRNVPRDGVLAIVTANVPEGAGPAVLAGTRRLADRLRQAPDVLLIERTDPPLPRRQGVGLARKLAADTAAALIAAGRVRSPWIFMTDADAILPASYFQTPGPADAPGTLVFPYRHAAEDAGAARRIALYELHMRHYVLGLRAAGSPYGYHSLGSTIAIHAATYATVRGVPRRNAGEDFYLLNKAAKVGPVRCLAEPVLTLSARPSRRVPFGTGPALAAIPDDPERYQSFPREAFHELAELLRALRAWALADEPTTGLPVTTLAALNRLRWAPAGLARQHPPGTRRLRAVLEWFDAFRTMRFLRMRRCAAGPAPLLATLRAMWDLPGAGSGELLEEARRREGAAVMGVASRTTQQRTLSG